VAERGGGAGWLRKFDRWIVRPEGGGEYRLYCPLHENPETSKSASASMNPSTGKFMCFSRCGGYGISQVWRMVQEGDTPERKVEGVTDIQEAPSRRRRRATQEQELPTMEKVEEWHDRLMAKSSLLREMHERRGLSEQTLERWLIGWNGDRYTIPILNGDGELINVRRYKMGAANDKMLNWPGHGDACLYGVDALDDSKVLITEGEMDMLLARQYGFPSLTVTAGAGTWMPSFTPMFFGKSVYVVYDVDEAGEKGAKKVAAALAGVASAVRIVKLPLTKKGSDLTDYFVNQGYGRRNLVTLLKTTPVYEDRRVSRQRAQVQPVPVRMRESFSPVYLDKPVELVATVSGRGASPSALPRKVEFTCDQDWQKPKCSKCPMETLYGGQHVHQVASDDPVILRMLEKPEDQRHQEVLKDLDIPKTCPRVQTHLVEQWRVDELAVVPNVDDPEEGASEQILRRVFNVTSEESLTPVNTTARITGLSTADPRNGRVVMQSWDFRETKTSLDSFQMTPELAERLAVFQPAEGETAMHKLEAIAQDMAANVTHIYGRSELHIAYDLVWHSLLDFTFRGSQLGKGWLELLVMGDTRTGKSEAALRLTRHYQAGILKSCEGATLAGLVGGAQQIGNSWVITWGTIPLQDRRLVILDEVSGIADKNVLEQMSAVRSSGRAQVSKIVSQETNARTRLVWISNPKDGKFINQTNNGAIDAIQTLIANPEDVARFDMAMVAASDDVPSSVINAARPPRAEHLHTSELCSALVTWAWSRTPGQVVWDRGVERFVLQCAQEMGQRYIADPPLVQGENVRVKLARLAVAVAARLFSHVPEDPEVVHVKREHVRTAVDFLDRIYSMKRFGYAAHSKKELRAKESAANSRSLCRRWLLTRERVLQTLMTVINDTQFRSRDLEEFGGLDREEAATCVIELLRMGMIRRRSKGYINMTPELISIIREIQEEEE
jgi:hypothetical protein